MGGNPDQHGETTLDAMIMDGPTHDVGAVASLRRVKNAISVARKVLENTEHSLLVGDLATNFALQMGFKQESLTTERSKNVFIKWKENKCQPNYWRNVEPNPKTNCGPFTPKRPKRLVRTIDRNEVTHHNHDTITMIVIDHNGKMAVGTSTNGIINKIPGRVGDSPIPGAGAYVDQDYGGASATGDGDLIMRFLPSYQAVENLRQGMDATKAAEAALQRITAKYPRAQAAIIVADNKGGYGAACINIGGFPYPINGGFFYSVCNPTLKKTTVKYVDCISKLYPLNKQ